MTGLFSHIFGIITPIDFHIFQRGSIHQPGIFTYKTGSFMRVNLGKYATTMELGYWKDPPSSMTRGSPAEKHRRMAGAYLETPA